MDPTFLNSKIYFLSWNKQYGRQKLQKIIVKVRFHTVKIELATRYWLSYQYGVVSINTQRRVKTQAARRWCLFERRQGHVTFFCLFNIQVVFSQKENCSDVNRKGQTSCSSFLLKL